MSPRITPKNRIPDIVSAAVSVFSRKGYRLTRMEEIAAEANVSKATLYYYFKSKIHLFQYVLQVAGDGQNDLLPPQETRPPTEPDFLRMLKRKLKQGTRLESVQGALDPHAPAVGIAAELSLILNELWEINEKNRVQIIMLERSFFEFPELAQVYDTYARRRVLRQIEEYLRARMRQGAVRKLHSVEATSRFLVESLAWFGFKQPAPPHRLFSKEEVLPDLVALLVSGLKT